MNETTADIVKRTAPDALLSHDLASFSPEDGVLYEKRPARRPDGSVADGLFKHVNNGYCSLLEPKASCCCTLWYSAWPAGQKKNARMMAIWGAISTHGNQADLKRTRFSMARLFSPN